MANMFGALNRFISRLDADPQAQKQHSGISGTYGFQVLRNNNPALPLEPWFDSIIGINGRTIDNPDPSLFVQELRNCSNTTISLGVFSAKGSQIREIFIAIPADGSPLGLALQWSPLNNTEDVWHILDVAPNSPADVAGLLPYSDYVIGSPEGLMKGEKGLGELVEDFLNRPLRLYVYNNEYDVTRLITITPARNWGGDGALGCILGYGALHRVPAPLTEPAQAPGETLFETARFSNEEPRSASTAPVPTPSLPPTGGDFLVPANMVTSPPPNTSGAGAGMGGAGEKKKKQRVNHAISPTAGLDDYFAEGEQKSRELDNAPTPKPTDGLPPPPKAGGPPRAAAKSPVADASAVGDEVESKKTSEEVSEA